MRVMTFNVRFENDKDGDNSWSCRREMASDLVRGHAPSILGTQEGKWSQLLYLRDHLPDYVLHAPGRVIDPTSQYPTLFFRREDFEVEEGGEFWLSKTPEVHRSKDWDSAFPRMMSYAGIRRKGEGQRLLWVAVTHLDHVGTEARYEQAKILSQWVRSRNGPVILMGDFNEDPGSGVHRLLTSVETGLEDTWQLLGREEGSDAYTHHGFMGVPQKSRIDWILISPHFRVTHARVVRDHFGDRYPSDHFPYEVELEWTADSP